MSPKPKPKSTIGSRIGITAKKVGKKVAMGALIGTLAAAPSYYVGKKVYSATKPSIVNQNIVLAKGNYLSEIKSVGQRITELNTNAKKEYSQKLLRSKNKEIKRKLYFYDEKQNKIVALEMDVKKATEIEKKQNANFERLDKIIEKKVTELNKNAKPEEVYFWNGDKISKLDLGVAKLRYIYDKLYSSEKVQLDNIYADIVKELKTSDKFSEEVALKMKELNDTARINYLSSLSVEEFAARFGNNPKVIKGLNEVIKSLEIYNEDSKNPRQSREVLNFVQKESKLFGNIAGVGAGAVSGIFLLSLWSKIKAYSRKKKK